MEQVEVVTISNTRDIAVQTTPSKEAGFEIVHGGDPSKIGFVHVNEKKSRCGCHERETYGLRGGVVRPVDAIEPFLP